MENANNTGNYFYCINYNCIHYLGYMMESGDPSFLKFYKY